ncbi:DUF3427 domain-containing protein [Bifidobacterium xylocopae]|uniref:DUF3427 domain-containing protein n=1 Tax=Bifidobacterium xylocopae TaxID=2493119 RepID=A0A366KBK1_9BIFI|nr:DUF3427 domain-containing protein [Bifidobacterium xylocopae]RBP99100.1 hypothetical protein CRD59_05470 [Bifidobacterium xylocopae]
MREGAGEPSWEDSHFIPVFVMRREESRAARYYYVGRVASFDDSRLVERTASNTSTGMKATVTDIRLAKPVDSGLYRHLTGNSGL